MNNSDDSDSIYSAPSSNTTFEPGDDLLAAYVGPKNADYYQQQFNRFSAGGGSVSWNWPAFFVTAYWLLYRKMWLNAFLYWIVLPVGLALISFGIALLAGEVASTAFYYASYGLISLLLVPLFANQMYYRHAQAKISKAASSTSSAEQHAAEVARIGGTSKVVWVILALMVIVVAGMVAAISIPAYQDYTIRAQVAEGLSLSGSAKAAISEQYVNNGEVPFDNAAAGLPDPQDLSGNYVARIAIEEGVIMVGYGNQAHDAIRGSTLVLEPAPGEGNTLTWECWSADIDARHLPAACR